MIIKNTRQFREQMHICDYTPFALHKDLSAFVISVEDFSELTFDDCINEIVVVVEQEWLFNLMSSGGVKKPQEYLCYSYTCDDAKHWFNKAVSENKIAAIEFN